MPRSPAATLLATLRGFALGLPDTAPKSPWPGHQDVAVRDKTFVYLSLHEPRVVFSVKLPVSGPQALGLPTARPTAYGLGKSGWVSIDLSGAPGEPPLATLKRWVMESYRAQAPKRVVKALEAAQPWVAAGGLPEPAPRRRRPADAAGRGQG
jgi:predicted DNA-binding protein (MmcQ/YjbR family)